MKSWTSVLTATSGWSIRFTRAAVGRVVAAATLFAICQLSAGVATGPLSVCPTNPRYFADKSGKAIYLTGSHTWCNFATDQGDKDPPAEFDFNGYLDFLTNHNHNFFRGWVWELAYSVEGPNGGPFRWNPFPWLRTGPGNATDGKPKFDLSQFNPAYFDRLHTRAMAARDRGIYVSIMLFQGYAIKNNRSVATRAATPGSQATCAPPA